MTNFEFLSDISEYALFSKAAIEAEKVFSTSPAMCAVGCRKALELAVKWVYSADNTIKMPYKDNLQSLIHETSFRFAVDTNTWNKLPFIIKLGNLAVHTEKSVSSSDALMSLEGLFEFIEWIDYCYGADYEEGKRDKGTSAENCRNVGKSYSGQTDKTGQPKLFAYGSFRMGNKKMLY